MRRSSIFTVGLAEFQLRGPAKTAVVEAFSVFCAPVASSHADLSVAAASTAFTAAYLDWYGTATQEAAVACQGVTERPWKKPLEFRKPF